MSAKQNPKDKDRARKELQLKIERARKDSKFDLSQFANIKELSAILDSNNEATDKVRNRQEVASSHNKSTATVENDL